jgi:peptidoglycan/LPS O-acetylase OafA/YrhL
MDAIQKQHSLTYNPSLDGLRGVAVFIVFMTHVHIFLGGRFGVDIFFVLSGYLITEVLYDSRYSKSFLWVFYFRRFLRLFPALAFLCAVVIAVCAVTDGDVSIYKDVLSSILYSQSWTSGFRDGFSLYLGHTWSLSVEEQFYILWPFVWVIFNRSDVKAAFVQAIILLCVSLMYQFYMSTLPVHYDRLYFSADTRFQAILIGAVGSIATRVKGVKEFLYSYVASVPVALMLVVGAAAVLYRWDAFSSFLISVLSLILIFRLTMKVGTVDAKILSVAPLVSLGKISYGFYLWHVPILVLLRNYYKFDTLYVFLIGLPASILASALSYRLIEQPALKLRSIISPLMQRKLGLFVVPVSVASIGVGLLYFQYEDISNFVRGTQLEVVAYGPKVYQVGDKGPLQPNGSLVMWVSLNSRPDMKSMSTVSGIKSVTASGKSGLNIVVPQSIAETPGKYVIQILTHDERVQLPPFEFEVVAAPL